MEWSPTYLFQNFGQTETTLLHKCIMDSNVLKTDMLQCSPMPRYMTREHARLYTAALCVHDFMKPDFAL